MNIFSGSDWAGGLNGQTVVTGQSYPLTEHTPSIINVKSTENVKGKSFNPYCTCHNRSCNGVKKTKQGKYFVY